MTTSHNSADTSNGAALVLPLGVVAGRESPMSSGPGASGLSDLAVSPFGMPLSLLLGEVRVAWLGRTSTHERQDPRQSLMRQLERCRAGGVEPGVAALVAFDVGGVVVGGALGAEARDRDGVPVTGAVADAPGLRADLFCPGHDDPRGAWLTGDVSVVRVRLLERKLTWTRDLR